MTTPKDTEREGLVETLLEELSYGGRKNYLDDTMGMDTAREILRTALLTHSAKERREGFNEGIKAAKDLLESDYPTPDRRN